MRWVCSFDARKKGRQKGSKGNQMAQKKSQRVYPHFGTACLVVGGLVAFVFLVDGVVNPTSVDGLVARELKGSSVQESGAIVSSSTDGSNQVNPDSLGNESGLAEGVFGDGPDGKSIPSLFLGSPDVASEGNEGGSLPTSIVDSVPGQRSYESIVASYEKDPPLNVQREIINGLNPNQVLYEPDSQTLSLQFEEPLEVVFPQLEENLVSRGWRVIESGSESVTTFVRDSQSLNWVCAQGFVCGKESCVIVMVLA